MEVHQIDRSKINKILVLKPRAIGDVLLSTPVLANIRAEFPNATIDFFVEEFAAQVVELNPFINRVHAINTGKSSPLSIIFDIRRARYDLVIDLFANPRTAIVTMFSGAPYRVGFPFKWRRHAYNIIVSPRSGEVHNVEFNLDALRRIGVPVKTTELSFPIDDQSFQFAADFIRDHNLAKDSYLTVNIGGGWQIKRWPIDKFVELCRMIDDRLNMPVVILYGPSEIDDALRVQGQSNAILAPQTSLRQMGAIMKYSRLLITNDSGPMHIAAALRVPTLAIFGPTNPKLQGPYGNISAIVRNENLDCLSCNLIKCPIKNICMTQLEAESVFRHLLEFMRTVKKMKRG